MTENSSNRRAEDAFYRLVRLFGSLPLRKKEESDRFKEVFVDLFYSLVPTDFMGDVYTFHIAHDTWSIFQLIRDRALLIEKKTRQHRLQIAIKVRSNRIAMAAQKDEERYKEMTEELIRERMVEMNRVDQKFDEEAGEAPKDVDYAVVEEEWFYLPKLEAQIEARFRSRKARFREMEWYDRSFAKRARIASNAILESAIAVPQISTHEVPLLSSNVLAGELDQDPQENLGDAG